MKSKQKQNRKHRHDKKINYYYRDYDLIRLIACIAVLFYHLNILKGGYLAVCIFFVLSGYLSIKSSYKKQEFSLKKYYVSKLLRLYLPLIIVVFMTIFTVSLFKNITWFNLKPEATSAIFGYNNFWQLGANLDYFARHIDSPFMHLWYISILLQLDLVFPFIYLGLRKIENKVSKKNICRIALIITILSTIYFFIMSLTNNLMSVYYSTFTRLFSYAFGLCLGIYHIYIGEILPKVLNKKELYRYIFYGGLSILCLMFIFISSKSSIYSISMIITTLITCLLIDIGTTNKNKELSKNDKLIKNIVSISYEVYLVQYPVIYLFQYLNINKLLKLFIILILVIAISYLLHFCINNKNKKYKKVKDIMSIIIIIISLIGMFEYIIAKDHTKEMNELKDQLAHNEKMLQQNQEEYADALKKREEELMNSLEELEKDQSKLDSVVSSLPVVGIGDSVMLGAVEELSKTFPKGYFDAKVSRSTWKAQEILQELSNMNLLGEPVILHLGTNGDCSKECKMKIMEICGDREVYWLNTTNLDYVNDNLVELAISYDNLHIIDWKNLSKGHDDYFYADGIHLTATGREAYAKAIYDVIYNSYLEVYKAKQQRMIEKHKEELKNRISFYGNDIIINSFDYLKDNFKEDKFITNKDFKYNDIKNSIIESIKEDTITKKIVFAFDESSNLNIKDYKELIELCSDYEVYVVAFDKTISKLDNYSNVTVLNFYKEIKKHKDYLMADGKHLTKNGNIAFSKYLKNNIK